MADMTEVRMNLAAVKRVDPYIKDIIDTATHVALYTFSTTKNEWEKTDIEGALFVYSRTGEPYNNILIMNRLNTNNLVEPIIKDLDLQVQEPFLLYKNSRSQIFGIWFYDKEECVRISALLELIVKDSNNKKTEKMNPKKNGGVDIFGMLSKAQEDYNMNKLPGQAVGIIGENKPHPPQGPDGTSQSVMDFFAKAKGQQKENPAKPTAGLFHPQRIVAAIGLPHDTGETQLKPFLQRLMSNPAHSVEHIEKQQRAVTPQAEKQNQNKPLQSPTQNASNNQAGLLTVKCEIPETLSYVGSIPLQPDQASPKSVPIDLSYKMSYIHISPSTASRTQPHHSGVIMLDRCNSQQNDGKKGSVDVVEDRSSVPFKFTPRPTETQQKPLLKTPAMFTSSAKKEAVVEAGTPKSSGKKSQTVPKSSNGSVDMRPEPLTKNQLHQAFNYLLKNDPDFMNKIHEAYVKSLSELIP